MTRGDLSHPERRITDHGGQAPAARLTRMTHARSGLASGGNESRHDGPVASLTPAIIAASVALVVAVLTPLVTSLRTRRQAIHDRFDAALAALLMAQAARHTPTGMA